MSGGNEKYGAKEDYKTQKYRYCGAEWAGLEHFLAIKRRIHFVRTNIEINYHKEELPRTAARLYINGKCKGNILHPLLG